MMHMPSRARLAVAFALGLALAGPAVAIEASNVCDDTIVDKVLDDAGAPDEGHVRASACMPLSGSQGLIAVAVAYEPAGYVQRGRLDLPVHVAWYDSRAGHVVARTRADIGEDENTQVDDSSLRWEPFPGLGRDAAALVVTDFILASFMDGDNGPNLTLFVADGPHLQAVLGPAMVSYAQCSRACRDADMSERHTRTLSLAPGRESHHGLRDVVATVHDSNRATPTRQQLRFNGHRYEPGVDDLLVR